MSVQTDITEIKTAIDKTEADLKQAWRSLRKLHNLLATKLASNAELLGLSEEEVTAMGGGTDKTDPPDEE